MTSPYSSQYDNIRERIEYHADMHGIPRNIGVWQLWQENKFRSSGCSYAGACGIAQFIPATAARYGVNVNDIDSSLHGWGRYMRDLLDMFNGRIDIALAGYNSGENRNEYKAAARENRPINWDIMPQGVRSETQNYVKTIMGNAGALTPISSNNQPSLVINDDDNNALFIIGALLLLGLLA